MLDLNEIGFIKFQYYFRKVKKTISAFEVIDHLNEVKNF